VQFGGAFSIPDDARPMQGRARAIATGSGLVGIMQRYASAIPEKYKHEQHVEQIMYDGV
jgi:hypothetical protein